MDRLAKFAHHRFVGDKRTQVVYDIDELDDTYQSVIDELVVSECFLGFGPDSLAEARNRGYKLFGPQRASTS